MDRGPAQSSIFGISCPDAKSRLDTLEDDLNFIQLTRKKLEEQFLVSQPRQEQHIKEIGVLNFNSHKCSDYENIHRAFEIYKGRELNIMQKEQLLKETQEDWQNILKIYGSGLSGEQKNCFDDCFEVGKKEAIECSKTCAISEDTLKTLAWDKKIHPKGCKAISKKTTDALKERFDQVAQVTKTEAPLFEKFIKKTLEDFAKLKSNYEKEQKILSEKTSNFPDKKCAQSLQKKRQMVQDGVRRAYVFTDDQEKMGSLFYVKTAKPGVSVSITALHTGYQSKFNKRSVEVLYDQEDNSDQLSKILNNTDPNFDKATLFVKNREEKRARGQFDLYDIEPGRFDRSNDMIISRERRWDDNSSFSVVSHESVPIVGQKFMIAGYPENRQMEFTIHSCVFKGFIEIKDSEAMGYLLYCPTIESSLQRDGLDAGGTIKGMSGGPVVDDDGIVWGAVESTDLEEYNYVHVAPVSKDKTGKILMGVQTVVSPTKNSKNCYRIIESTSSYEPYACQVFPGSNEFPIPKNKEELEKFVPPKDSKKIRN